MSRYFAVLLSMTSQESYVIAEVVRELSEVDKDPLDSLAGQLIGSEGRIMTLEQLQATPDGRRALQRWQSGNDAAFDAETLREDEPETTERPWDPDAGPTRHLHSVD